MALGAGSGRQYRLLTLRWPAAGLKACGHLCCSACRADLQVVPRGTVEFLRQLEGVTQACHLLARTCISAVRRLLCTQNAPTRAAKIAPRAPPPPLL